MEMVPMYDPRPTEMSQQDAIDSEHYEREELWWYIKQIEAGKNLGRMSDDVAKHCGYGEWWQARAHRR